MVNQMNISKSRLAIIIFNAVFLGVIDTTIFLVPPAVDTVTRGIVVGILMAIGWVFFLIYAFHESSS